MDHIFVWGFNGFQQVQNVKSMLKSFMNASVCGRIVDQRKKLSSDLRREEHKSCKCNDGIEEQTQVQNQKRPYHTAFPFRLSLPAKEPGTSVRLFEPSAPPVEYAHNGSSGIQQAFSLPEAIHLHKTEITWSRIGMTFVSESKNELIRKICNK
jgi:hypothetical protein